MGIAVDPPSPWRRPEGTRGVARTTYEPSPRIPGVRY